MSCENLSEVMRAHHKGCAHLRGVVGRRFAIRHRIPALDTTNQLGFGAVAGCDNARAARRSLGRETPMSQRRERAIDVPKHSSDVRPGEHPFGIERKVLIQRAQPLRQWCEETKPDAEPGMDYRLGELPEPRLNCSWRATIINAPEALIGPVKRPG